MKNVFFAFVLFMSVINDSFSQKVDTIYYDRQWQGVKYKELAEYVRYDFNFNDPQYNNKSRIFYINGKLEREGTPVSTNKFNGLESKWKGMLTTYYMNGVKKTESNFNDEGFLHGNVISWDEAGNMLSKENYDNGVLNGLSTIYAIDNSGVSLLTYFENGKPKNNETLMSFPSGRKTKIDFYTKKIIVVKPSINDCQTVYKDGLETLFYDINGIFLGINYARINSYGKYYKCYLHFINNSTEPIEIDPSEISGDYVKGEISKPLAFISAEDYLAKIARSQALLRGLQGFSSGMASYNAGYSTSTSTSSGVAVGTGGWASGVGTTTTTVYNPAQKQAVMDREAQKMDSQIEQDKKVKEAMNGELLKKTVVEPGEEIYKSFYIKYLSTDKLIVNIKINNLQYPFICEKLNLFWPN